VGDQQERPLLHDVIDLVARSGLPAEDLDREKRIAMAAAVIASSRNRLMRSNAMAQIRFEAEARSPAVLAAIAAARWAPGEAA
jgi:hypothetical protein